MNINVRTVEGATVVEMAGELDAQSAPLAQRQILPLAAAGGTIVLDMAGVSFMSSAGLRLLLTTYRQVTASGGRIAVAGLSDELRETMSMTGFLNFFSTHDSVESGLRALGALGAPGA